MPIRHVCHHNRALPWPLFPEPQLPLDLLPTPGWCWPSNVRPGARLFRSHGKTRPYVAVDETHVSLGYELFDHGMIMVGDLL